MTYPFLLDKGMSTFSQCNIPNTLKTCIVSMTSLPIQLFADQASAYSLASQTFDCNPNFATVGCSTAITKLMDRATADVRLMGLDTAICAL